MIKLHELKPAKGSVKKAKRIGRGHASGAGKTAGRGQKGQNSRSGGGKGPGFEGGQNPIQRRLPKLPGFINKFRVEYQPVNVSLLNTLEDNTEVTPEILESRGMIRTARKPVKVLGNGELKVSLTVKADAFSLSAKNKIEAAGGSTEII